MCHLLLAVFLSNPLKHTSASVVVEVNVDIGQGDTVRVKESFEKEVVFDRVDACDFQAVRHGRTCSRSTSWTDPYAEFLTCCTDVVLHDEEVARESHRLHDVKLKIKEFLHALWYWVAVIFLCAVVCKFLQVVRLKFYSV